MARNTAHGKKVPFFKTWWFWVIIILFIYGFVTGIKNDDAEEETDQTTQSEESSRFEDETDSPDGFVCTLIMDCEKIAV